MRGADGGGRRVCHEARPTAQVSWKSDAQWEAAEGLQPGTALAGRGTRGPVAGLRGNCRARNGQLDEAASREPTGVGPNGRASPFDRTTTSRSGLRCTATAGDNREANQGDRSPFARAFASRSSSSSASIPVYPR